jgi:stage II sporulation protein D
MKIQYHYSGFVALICIGYFLMMPIEAKKHTIQRPQINADMQQTVTTKNMGSQSLQACNEQLPSRNAGLIPVETHKLNQVVPQDRYSTDATATKACSIQIRVLLDEVCDTSCWQLESESGFWLLDPSNMKRCISVEEPTISISSKSGHIYINGKRLTKDRVVIKAKESSISYNQHTYQGSLYVVCVPGKMLLINCVDLEDYVACVLNSEAWPGWPFEMHKVLAIAIRTYAVAMMREAADCKRVYHIKNSIAHQVYEGSHDNKIMHEAVEQTSGIIMAYNKKPIIAMYDACCGGIVTSRMKGINFKKAPYLARNYPCTYCKTCKIYSWKAEFTKEEFTKLVHPYMPNVSKVKSVLVSKKDGAGLVQEVSIKSARGITALPGRKIYGLPKIKSFYFSIENTPSKIIFTGRGYGHHVGLCQWGACQMVRDGLDYKKILRFYYPGISFMKIVR